MDWQALGTLIALLGVTASFALTLRGQRQERAIAENTASRSEAAARLTEEYTARVVASLERLATASGQSMSTPAPRWSLTHSKGDTFRLENIGNADAYSVEVTGHRSLIGPDHFGGDIERVAPGEAITFMAALVLATSDTTITVTWSEEPSRSERSQWRYPLPA